MSRIFTDKKNIFFHYSKILIYFLLSAIFFMAGCSTKSTQVAVPSGIQKETFISDKENAPKTLFFQPSGIGLSDHELLALLKDKKYILIGEQHTFAHHHLVQAELIIKLAKTGQNTAIGLEMIDATQQPVLDDFNKGLISVEELPLALDWEKTWGYDYELYKPIFEAAALYKTPLYALNISRKTLDQVRKKGFSSLNSAQKKEVPPSILLSPDPQRQRLKKFFTTHAKSIVEEGKTKLKPDFERFILTQSIWDSAMAENAVAAHKKENKTIIILAGGAHVAHAYGIAARLPVFDKNATYSLIMPTEKTKLSAYEKEAADIFYLSIGKKPLRLGIVFDQKNMKVLKVLAGSPAEDIGIIEGDLIISFYGTKVNSLKDLHDIGLKNIDNKKLEIKVRREGKEIKLKA